MDLVSLLCIMFCALPIISYRKIKMERAVVVTIALLIGGGYLGGIFGNFLYGLIPMGMVLAFGAVIGMIQKKICPKDIFSSGCCFLLMMTIVSMAYHHNSVVSSWDDLADWAAATKNMFYTNQFACAAGNTISRYLDYLPGVQMFSYIWLKIGNIFSDTRLFVSYNMLAYIFFAPFLSHIEGKVKTILFSVVLICAPNLFLANGWSMLWTLQIDTMVAAIFGYLLYIVYTGKYDEWELYAGVFILCLSKQVGVLFALVIAGILLIREVNGICLKKKDNRNKRELLIYLGVILFVVGSWGYVKRANHVINTGSNVYQLLFKQGFSYFKTLEPYQIKGFMDFWKCFMQYDQINETSQTAYYMTPYFKVSGVVWLILLLISMIWCSRKYGEKIVWYYHVLLLAGFAGYIVFISSLYLINFSPGENAILSSAGRYVGTYYLSAYLLLIGLYLETNKKEKINADVVLMIILGIVLPCGNMHSTHVGGLTSEIRAEKNYQTKERQKLLQQMEQVMNAVGTEANIIMDNGTILDNARCNYLLFPNKVALWGYIWQIEPQHTHIILNNETNSLDAEFVSKYGDYFENGQIVDKGIYSIDRSDGNIKMHYIDTIK